MPVLLVTGVFAAAEQREPTQPSSSGVPVTLPKATTAPRETIGSLYLPVMLDTGGVNMDLEEYLVGVLLAEVSAAFELEALKAQAVAARTYALKCHQQGYKHQGSICTNAACCQGYLSPERYIEKGGDPDGVDRMRRAVLETRGQVLYYADELILATYFDCSGGSTEDAAAVWGGSYPYLQAVESPAEEFALHYTDEKTFTPETFQTAIGIGLDGQPETWFGAVTYTPGNGVDTIEICGVPYKGTTLRSLLGLRSTIFTVKVAENMITFTTRGYGHRVGLSQYGAEAMAMQGSDYRQILAHYYRGSYITMYEISA